MAPSEILFYDIQSRFSSETIMHFQWQLRKKLNSQRLGRHGKFACSTLQVSIYFYVLLLVRSCDWKFGLPCGFFSFSLLEPP